MSEEDAALQARIADLTSEKIAHPHEPLTANIFVQERIEHQKQGQQSHPSRWSPYGPPRLQNSFHYQARGGHKPFRNRTLVTGAGAAKASGDTAAQSAPQAPAENGITTRDRGRMQWTNSAVYEKKTQEKIQAIEATQNAKRLAKEEALKNRVVDHVYGQQSRNSTPSQASTPREIIVNELRFRVATDGSKLFRLFGKSSAPANTFGQRLTVPDGPTAEPGSTPKEAKVAGVAFVRTKHGNLIRKGLIENKRWAHHTMSGRHISLPKTYSSPKKQAPRKLCADFTSTGTHFHFPLADRGFSDRLTDLDRHRLPRSYFTCTDHLTGACNRGNRCKFRHDIDKLAICKEYLRNGKCADGENCNLSHDANPHRVPTCLHFLRNSCTKPDCRYSHVKVEPTAPICRDFARLGYCDKGESCPDRHVSECPDYTNTGSCPNPKCRLPHIDRAGTLRKAAAQKAVRVSDDDLSIDVSSDEDFDEIDSDDADSDEIDEDLIMAGAGANNHELSQQQDFISLS